MKQYIDNFTKEIFTTNTEESNIAFSPIGAWVNLAIFGKAFHKDFNNEQIQEIETALCSTIQDAYTQLQEIYKTTPEFISFAIAFWKQSFEDSFSEDFYTNILNTVSEISTDVEKITVSNKLPSQEEIDEWVNENSKGIIKEFPADVTDPNLEAIIANIIALKIDWDSPYKTVQTPQNMNKWGTSQVLYKRDDDFTKLYKINNEIYGIHKNTKTYGNKTVEVYSIISDNNDDYHNYEILSSFITDNSIAIELSIEELKKANVDFADVQIMRLQTDKPSSQYNIHYPSWDVAYKRDLNSMVGFKAIVKYFKNLETPKEILNYQVVNSSYHKDGYEAAALTYGMVLRSALIVKPLHETAIVDVFFNKSFISITTVRNAVETDSWANEPLFISKIVEASEIEE